MTPEHVARFNKQFHEFHEGLRRVSYRKCLFTEDCNREVINAHSVSAAVLRTIADDGHVISPNSGLVNDDGLLKPNLSMVREGVNRASRGTFACHHHDALFEAIDQTPININDPKVQQLLLYRAVLRELWFLLAARTIQTQLDPMTSHLYHPGNHPMKRIESLYYLKRCLSKSSGSNKPLAQRPQ